MKELKGTKTEKNLMEAFAGESMARNKYSYFASRAKKDGYQQIAALFEETAANEKEHAKLWFKYLEGGTGGRGGGLHRNSSTHERRGSHREAPRGALSETSREHREGRGVLT